MAIKKNQPLKIELTAEELNIILDGLSVQPYKKVYHLIEKIHQQVHKQSQESEEGKNPNNNQQ